MNQVSLDITKPERATTDRFNQMAGSWLTAPCHLTTNNGETMTTNVQEVTWKDKTYKIPFDVNLKWDKNQEVEIKNRFSGEPCKLPWFAAAVYDLIMGAEQFEDWQTHRDGLDWFIDNFPKEYMVLLD